MEKTNFKIVVEKNRALLEKNIVITDEFLQLLREQKVIADVFVNDISVSISVILYVINIWLAISTTHQCVSISFLKLFI